MAGARGEGAAGAQLHGGVEPHHQRVDRAAEGRALPGSRGRFLPLRTSQDPPLGFSRPLGQSIRGPVEAWVPIKQ
eukprot:1182134-Prorocentrum_minimum.AAC.5